MPPAYGTYCDGDRAFAINDPRTPRPWFNYLWNGRYTALISHTGGGFSFVDSPRDNRLTRMRYNCLPWDRPGRYVLVKDAETGRFWSLSWAPTIDAPYRSYNCTHGLGFTRITTEVEGIYGVITYFVPRDRLGEVWQVTLENRRDRPASLEIYAFTELLMGNALNDLINQPNDKHFTDIHFDRDRAALVATRRYWVLNKGVSVKQPNLGWGYRLFFGSSLPITGFDSSLDAFIGRWRSEANPIAVETSTMGNTEITAGDPIAALQSRVHLPSGDRTSFALSLTVAPTVSATPSPPPDAHAALEEVHAYWEQYLSTFSVSTPDADFNRHLSIWNPYQAAVTFDMARNAGYYHGGLLFGTGMRDRFQDILGVVMVEPDRVRRRLLDALRYQFADGSTLHNFFVLTETGERTNHSDTPLWIPFGIVVYLNETADFSILEEGVPYHQSDVRGTVYEHLLRALDFALANRSDRGMARIFNGDWNDTLDHVGSQGRGETVWGTCFLGYVLQSVFPLLEYRQDTHQLARLQAVYKELGSVLNTHCWDGEWYLRAFCDDGSPLGTHRHSEGQIFLNAQSWAILSGLAPADRARQALHSCRDRLLTPYGMQIVAPAFRHIADHIGLISRCVPGKKENGAVFNHASSWFVLAALLHGEVELGWEVYRRMLPANSAQNRDRYEVEPYVFAEYVTSPEHETQGQASHSWLTGTAVWMLRIGLDCIIGLRPTLQGMEIDPHIPTHWPELRAQRKFRGYDLHLHLRNPHQRNCGLQELTINGIPQTSPHITLADWTEKTLHIQATL
jgi:cellobiose phosphorylase